MPSNFPLHHKRITKVMPHETCLKWAKQRLNHIIEDMLFYIFYGRTQSHVNAILLLSAREKIQRIVIIRLQIYTSSIPFSMSDGNLAGDLRTGKPQNFIPKSRYLFLPPFETPCSELASLRILTLLLRMGRSIGQVFLLSRTPALECICHLCFLPCYL